MPVLRVKSSRPESVRQSFTDALQGIANFSNQIGNRRHFFFEIDVWFGQFESHASGLAFQEVQRLVVIQEDAHLR